MIEKLFSIGIFIMVILLFGMVACQIAMDIQSSISTEPGSGHIQNFERDTSLPSICGCLVIGTPILLFLVSCLRSTKKKHSNVR